MSGITVRLADETELQLWDEFVSTLPNHTPFHLLKWLQSIEKSTSYKLELLVAYKGEKWLGVFPIFTMAKYKLNMAFSPPPGLGISEMGPLVAQPYDKDFKNESIGIKVNQAFIEHLNGKNGYQLMKFHLASGIVDVRPFVWSNFETNPYYTYYLDIEQGADKVLKGFDGRVRTSIKKAETVENLERWEDNKETFKAIIQIVRDRYAEQNLKYKPTEKYFDTLYDNLGSDILKCYACGVNGKLEAGLILITLGDTVRHWIGGINRKDMPQGLNEWLHFEAIKELSEKGYKWYEFMGANTERLIDNKMRYNPSLRQYFMAEYYSPIAKTALKLAKIK